MNLDILSKLPFLNDSGDQVEGAPVDEVDAKKERIRYHREHVRNGPVKMRRVTTGQERRFRKRTLDGMTRKARRRQIKTYFADQQEAATIRGNLQAVGVMSYVGEHRSSAVARRRATIWLIQNYATGEGEIQVTEQVVLEAFQNALSRWGAIVGLPGQILPEGYEIPVSLAS